MNKTNINKIKASIDFQSYLAKQLKNPKIRKHYEFYDKQLEIAYQILELRKKRGLSQMQLAQKMNTSQTNIARMEAGQQNFTTATLNKVADALGAELEVCFR